MGTLAEELLAHRIGRPVTAGEIVVAPVDWVMAHDVTSPLAIEAFRQMDRPLWDPSRVVLMFDHVMPATTVAAAESHIAIRTFAEEFGVRHMYAEGICHQVMLDRGHIRPGTIVVGADSHSTTYGALACFGTGLGSTDIGVAMATGFTWFRVPETLRVELHGNLRPGVSAKDVALSVIRQIGADGANYLALEWGGEVVTNMSLDSRCTLANLSVDCGAKVGLIATDAVLRAACGDDIPDLQPRDPHYLRVIEVDVAAVEPQVSIPPAIDNVRDISDALGIALDEVFIGSCTNGRLEDMAMAAQILDGREVHPGTRTLVVPASRSIFLQALERGYVETITRSGATVVTAGCGPCLGRQSGVMGAGERVLSTSNRNYPGRMGSPDAEIYLASPAVAAASAIRGAIADPREFI